MAQSAQEFSIVNNETLITCPYDPVHKIRAKKIMYHLSKCSKSHRYYSGKVLTCLYDSTHVVREDEYLDHMKVCCQRHTICQEMTPQYEENLGRDPFTRETFSDSRYQAEEDWGAEVDDSVNSKPTVSESDNILKASVIPIDKIKGLSRYHKRLYLDYFGTKLQAQSESIFPPDFPDELSYLPNFQDENLDMQQTRQICAGRGAGRGIGRGIGRGLKLSSRFNFR